MLREQVRKAAKVDEASVLVAGMDAHLIHCGLMEAVACQVIAETDSERPPSLAGVVHDAVRGCENPLWSDEGSGAGSGLTTYVGDAHELADGNASTSDDVATREDFIGLGAGESFGRSIRPA